MTADKGEEVVEAWMKRIGASDIYGNTQCVDELWAAGSGLDISLLADPFIHELM